MEDIWTITNRIQDRMIEEYAGTPKGFRPDHTKQEKFTPKKKKRKKK